MLIINCFAQVVGEVSLLLHADIPIKLYSVLPSITQGEATLHDIHSTGKDSIVCLPIIVCQLVFF